MKLREYFGTNETDIYNKEILSDRLIFIQKRNDTELCVEITDKNGNSVNIGCYVDISLDTAICDITDIVLDYLFDNYLYNNC